MCNTCIHYRTDKCKLCYGGKIINRGDHKMFKQIEVGLLLKALEELTATEELETRVKIVDFLHGLPDYVSVSAIQVKFKEDLVKKGLALYLRNKLDVKRSPEASYNDLIVAGIKELARREYQ